MNSVGNKTLIALLTITAMSTLAVVGFQINDIIADETEKKSHKFADDTKLTAVFSFRNGDELVEFEVFNQESGFSKNEPVIWEMQTITGKTPMLHQAAEQAQKWSDIPGGYTNIWDDFQVTVYITQGDEVIQTFSYRDCAVKDYDVKTDFDKEEGWMGKGFAVKDIFEFQCEGYTPNDPNWEEEQHSYAKSSSMSSKDLVQPSETWEDNPKFKSNGLYGN